MSSASTLRRTLLIALASLALCAPAAAARPADLRSEVPTSALSGTIFEDPMQPVDQELGHLPGRSARLDSALAQERSYSSYDEPAVPAGIASTAVSETGDGIAWAPFVLAVLGALLVGLGAGSRLDRAHARRHATRLAT